MKQLRPAALLSVVPLWASYISYTRLQIIYSEPPKGSRGREPIKNLSLPKSPILGWNCAPWAPVRIRGEAIDEADHGGEDGTRRAPEGSEPYKETRDSAKMDGGLGLRVGGLGFRI